VLAEEDEARVQLVADLVQLGYRPLVHVDGDMTPPDLTPFVVLILSEDVKGHAVPCSETLRRTDHLRSVPLLWLVDASDLGHLAGNEHLLDEFLTVPYPTAELGARIALLRNRSSEDPDDVIRRGPLALNPLSYQVSLEGAVLDLTFMEYELLKLLMGYPGRVYTREEILSLVWGYDYFGGMRTVDVHVRRVRAKLGQDHAWLIETVRGVGYRLAQVRG
jgi:two-component system, OmpR family, alkaline phosphatase synthesis response regulator PhoP